MSPTNHISSNNHSGHGQTHTETSTTVIPKTAIGRIIGRRGNKIDKIQSQNNVEITTWLTIDDYQDVKITGNTSNINNALNQTIRQQRQSDNKDMQPKQ